ncbi:hypothetical protein BC829DRAFT_447970 [Chytridium lagenaria]|nr:hypothetical protein BC829DRAFT_447970 [Chytridium lagenaria]
MHQPQRVINALPVYRNRDPTPSKNLNAISPRSLPPLSTGSTNLPTPFPSPRAPPTNVTSANSSIVATPNLFKSPSIPSSASIHPTSQVHPVPTPLSPSISSSITPPHPSRATAISASFTATTTETDLNPVTTPHRFDDVIQLFRELWGELSS